jgi:putative oxidoreductase
MSTSTHQQLPGALPLAGRILLASIFIASGLGKLAAPAATQGYIASVGAPLPLLAYAVAVIVELAGGAMLLVGYRTKAAALTLAVFTIAAAALFHNNFADQMQMIMFMKNLAITGGLLHVVAFGPGRVSIDNRLAHHDRRLAHA